MEYDPFKRKPNKLFGNAVQMVAHAVIALVLVIMIIEMLR